MVTHKDRGERHITGSVKIQNRNRFVMISLVSGALGMLALAFASVPLYEAFCRATGFGGQPRRSVLASDKIVDRLITVRFDANHPPDLPWAFKPLQTEIQVRPGETSLAFYRVVNQSDKTITAMATYNVNPLKLGFYFVKLECFCFEEQTLGPGESVDMPVAFYLDPAMEEEPRLNKIEEVTLSYTFFKQDGNLKKEALLEKSPLGPPPKSEKD